MRLPRCVRYTNGPSFQVRILHWSIEFIRSSRDRHHRASPSHTNGNSRYRSYHSAFRALALAHQRADLALPRYASSRPTQQPHPHSLAISHSRPILRQRRCNPLRAGRAHRLHEPGARVPDIRPLLAAGRHHRVGRASAAMHFVHADVGMSSG